MPDTHAFSTPLQHTPLYQPGWHGAAEARETFASVIDIGESDDFALQPALVDAVADAEHGANDLFANGHAHQLKIRLNRRRP